MKASNKEIIKRERDHISLACLANAIEVGKRVVRGVEGEGIVKGFGGEALTETGLTHLMANKIYSHLNLPEKRSN